MGVTVFGKFPLTRKPLEGGAVHMWIIFGIFCLTTFALMALKLGQFAIVTSAAAVFFAAIKLEWIQDGTFAVIGLIVLAIAAVFVVVAKKRDHDLKIAVAGGLVVILTMVLGAINPLGAVASNIVEVQYANGQREIATEVEMSSNDNKPLVGSETFNNTTVLPSLDCKDPVHTLRDLVKCVEASPKKKQKAYIDKVNSYKDQLGGDWNRVKQLAKQGVDTRAIVVINDPKLTPDQARSAVKSVTGSTKHKLPVYHINGKDILTTRGGFDSNSLELIKLHHKKAVRVLLTIPAPGQTVNIAKAKTATGFFVECKNINPGVVDEVKKPAKKPSTPPTTAESQKPVPSRTPPATKPPTSPPTTTTPPSTPPTTSTPPTSPPSTPPSTPPTSPPSTPPSSPPTSPPSTPPTTPPTSPPSTPPSTPPTSPPTSPPSTPPTSPPSTPPTSPPTSPPSTPPTTVPTKNPTTMPTMTEKPTNNPSPSDPPETTASEPTKPAPPPETTQPTKSPTREIPPTSEKPTQAPDPTEAPTTVVDPDAAKPSASETPVVLKSMSSETPPSWMVLGFVLFILLLGGILVSRNLYKGAHKK
jgi:hypothetical protein